MRKRLKILEEKFKAKEISEEDYVLMKKAIMTELCKSDLPFLVTEVLDREYYKPLLAPFHYEMMDFAANDSKRKLLLVPRGHFKSSLVTIPICIQQILNNPNSRGLITSAVLGNSTDFLRSVKGYLESNQVLIELFGEFVSPKWNEMEIIVKQRDKKQIKESTLMASSIDKGIVSKHFDFIIADDLVNRETINTKEQLDKTITYYKDLLDLLDPDGTLIIIGTRWHFDDIYGYLMDEDKKRAEEGKDKLFELFFRGIYEDGKAIFPKKFTDEYVAQLRTEKGEAEFSCIPAETPILLSDFTEKPISEIKEGDEVIGFTRGDRSANGKLVTTKVKGVFSKTDTVYNLKMESGRTVRCTKDHKWFTSRDDATHKPYKPAKVGSRLMYVCPLDEYNISRQEELDWNYLAGFFDADGSAKSGGCLNITQSPTANPSSYKKIISVLDRLGLEYSEYIRKFEDVKRSDNNMIWLKDNFNTQLKLIRLTDLGKRQQIVDKMLSSGSKFIREKDRVVSITEDKRETVYGMETETNNYIAWGYASSNCQYLNNPIDSEHAVFKEEWIKYYDVLPNKVLSYFLTLDTNGGGLSKNADYNGWVLNAVDTEGIWWIIDCYHDRANVTEIINRLFTYNEKYPYLVIGLEKTMYVNAFYEELQREQLKRGRFLNIKELTHSTTSKEVRIKSLQPLFENGRVKLKKDMKDFRDEYLRFPKSRHDDIIDSLAMQKEIAETPFYSDCSEEIGIYNKISYN